MSKQGAPPAGGYAPPGGVDENTLRQRYDQLPVGARLGMSFDTYRSQNSTPSPYQQATEAQANASGAAVNSQTNQNRPDQYGPTGSVTWGVGPDGRPTQTTSLNPELEAALGGMFSQVRQGLSQPFSLSGLPQVDSGAGARQKAEDAVYARDTSRLDPQWAQRESAFKSDLASRGIDENSAAYQKATDQFSRQRNDAYDQARMGAQAYGGEEQQRQFGMSLADRQNALAEMLKGRTEPLSEMGALLSEGQPQFGSFMGSGLAQVPQYLAAAMGLSNYNLGATQANNEAAGDFWNGIGNAGKGVAAVAALSDERAKEDVERLPVDVEPGVPLTMFKYRGDPKKKQRVGVIAQDLEKVHPEAVATGPDGLKRVAPRYASIEMKKGRSGAYERKPFSLAG